jgi:hypothetical protein
MPTDPVNTTFERVLAAVGQCLDRQSAEALLRLRADREMQGRIEELADKSTGGTLTPEERDEYEALILIFPGTSNHFFPVPGSNVCT